MGLPALHSKLLGKLARCQRDLLALNMQVCFCVSLGWGFMPELTGF